MQRIIIILLHIYFLTLTVGMISLDPK